MTTSDLTRRVIGRARRTISGLAARDTVPSVAAPEPAEGLHECELYRGYDDADVARLELLRSPAPVAGKPGFATDFIGARTRIDMLPGADRFDGRTVYELPVPGDRLHAETAEYAALALAFSLAGPDRFQVFELGAGWAPWMTGAGLVAKRRGIGHVRLLGVEAGDQRFGFALDHLAENGLRPAGDEPVTELDGVRCELLHGAISWEDGELFFPTGDALDYGMAAQPTDAPHDYRGVAFEQRAVQAFALPRLLAEHGLVDLLHIDIQGTEAELIERSLGPIDEHVRVMCVGTHSRAIEGELLGTLHRAGWRLHGEKPCRFVHDADGATLEAMTSHDGVQTWVNPRLTDPV
ncbi:MAG: hypothetical protein QNJ12_04250 [Ilumatobacter sp.]|uniref:hypothetical protein n=1 Tax=Ilumatobacter sp. TaxID=1967498 RepID=UPI00261470A0|nr:hypothetical protein [Ilumatobacter sp.]MDJ0767976.1 hypothetical protein [Ilumatobacter sp.]